MLKGGRFLGGCFARGPKVWYKPHKRRARKVNREASRLLSGILSVTGRENRMIERNIWVSVRLPAAPESL